MNPEVNITATYYQRRDEMHIFINGYALQEKIPPDIIARNIGCSHFTLTTFLIPSDKTSAKPITEKIKV